MQLDLSPWRVKKLPDDSLMYLVPDADITADGGKMMIRVVAATETMDRERDILRVKGADLRNHRENPAVLFNHKRSWPSIALARDPGGNYTVKAVGNHLEADHYFIQKGPNAKLASQIFQLVENGSLRGVSPGFLSRPGGIHKVKGPDGHPALEYDNWELVEITHCPVPMNGESLVLSIEKGFGSEAMLPELKQELLPFIPERPEQVTSGWEAKSADELDDEDDVPDDERIDLELGPLTATSQFYHAVQQKTMDFIGFVEETRSALEADPAKSDAKYITAVLSGIREKCDRGQDLHRKTYPDQPGLPGMPGEEIGEAEMATWRRKAMEAWDKHVGEWQMHVAAEDAELVNEARQFLVTLAGDVNVHRRTRGICKQIAEKLKSVRMVTPQAGFSEENELAAIAKLLNGAAEELDGLKVNAKVKV